MAWPSALSVDADLLKHAYEQGITRLLEAGNTYTALHQGVALEIRNWVEGEGGIKDADLITNTTIYAPASALWVLAKIIKNRDLQLSKSYEDEGWKRLRQANKVAQLSEDMASGGGVARIVVLKQGQSHYTDFRSGAVFKNYRSSP